MKQLCIFLSLFLVLSCATKRKTKEVEKTEIKTENLLQNDSVFRLNSKVSKIETNQTFNEFESVLKALNVQYDGEQGNDLKVVLNRTEKGTELNVSGKGKANYNENTEQVKNLTRNDVVIVFDSIIDARVEQYKKERGQQLVDSFKSNTEKEKSDISIWVYVVVGSVLVVATVIYVGIKQIKK
ncbi:hypothetical protein [Empedobacter sp. GD03797]|uniref:hypothetical protein n=1 Tax=Empedobacter sp. GD03797 TaxID=2975382 RepID=UPI00244A5353|nr:hypothetical protein [Empedobacter sp. GD03797]MDH1884205.1 hypothetical protein [Empedobacter sp. GD03797]